MATSRSRFFGKKGQQLGSRAGWGRCSHQRMGPRRANLRLRRTLSAVARPSHAAQQQGDAEADETPAAGVGAAGQHPTDAERFKFGNEGFLVLPSLLPPTMVGRLLRALDDTVERRRQPGYTWPGRAERLGGGGDLLEADANRHVDTLLHEDPVFLELMTYPPVMDYVRGLFNPDGTPPSVHPQSLSPSSFLSP